MPRFHIHLYNSTGETNDEEGQELPGIEAAEQKAIEGIRSILSEEVRHGSLDLRGRAEIATTAGVVVQTVNFADTVQLHIAPDQP